MDTKDWIIVFATLLGPILAVQAQKAVESFRERRGQKRFVFSQLMATRAAKVSTDHVRALNMIDLVFYGTKLLGLSHRSKNEQAVLDAWKEYHSHLYTKFGSDNLPLWLAQGEELFTNLLFSMSKDLGFKFDRVLLKKGAYSPVAHEDLEAEQTALRKAAIKAFGGEVPIKVTMVSAQE
jgi:hypothetical protein